MPITVSQLIQKCFFFIKGTVKIIIEQKIKKNMWILLYKKYLIKEKVDLHWLTSEPSTDTEFQLEIFKIARVMSDTHIDIADWSWLTGLI